ncbi:MAG: hypothetical protein ACREA0_06810, partial [bacterium]
GVYLVDLGSGDIEQVVDWDDGAISWEGRGAERGLRGIAFYEEVILIAASNRVIAFDRDFNVVDSFANPYLKHLHEIHRAGDLLWVSSTEFSSVLGFDLKQGRFSIACHVTRTYPSSWAGRLNAFPRYWLRNFDPQAPDEPPAKGSLHVNNVFVHEGSLLLSGTGARHVLEVADGQVRPYARVPRGTHNAHPFREGVLANHTASNRIAFMSRRGRLKRSFPIKTYQESELEHSSLPADHARQAFGRGLCTWKGRLLIGGSSPATISAIDFDTGERLACVNIRMDVRNAIHGLEIWPF